MPAKKDGIIIDFTNEINNKLYFYESYKDGQRVEYAYIEYKDDFIKYLPEGDIEEHEFSKKEINEFLLNITNKIAKEKISSRIDLKSKTSVPYFNTKILGTNLPVIIFLALHMGLTGALKFIGVKYNISEEKGETKTKKEIFNVISLNITKDPTSPKYINMYFNNLYEEYMINGLVNWRTHIERLLNVEEVNSPEIWKTIISEKKAKNKPEKLLQAKTNLIDTTTEKILKIYGYNPNLLILMGKTIPKKLLNDEVDDIDNLSSQRIRMSESIAHLAYEQVQIALSEFKRNMNRDDARLRLHKDYIIKNIQGSGMLQQTRTVNPLEELLLSTKITKTGVGNMKKDMVTIQKRDLNESYYGTIAPTTTNEYGGIGANQALTNSATINDRFGSIMVKDFSNNSNSFDNLSFSESLMPFYEYDDTTRRVMGNQQFTQFIQLDEPDVPLVQTGFESIVPHIVSDRFAYKAKKDGQVTVKPDHILIKYKDGTEEIFNTKPTKARTKRGAYLPLEYNVLVKDGQKVKEKEILATTNSLKFGKLAVGKNLVVAELSYLGMNYEDGWVINETLNEKYKSKIYDKITIIIPEGVEVTKIKLDQDETSPGDILLEYKRNKHNEIDLDEETEETEGLMQGKEILGDVVRYRSIGGKIADVVVKINSKKVDDKVMNLWKYKTKEINKKISICNSLKEKIKQLDCRNNIDDIDSLEIGGHKISGNEIEGAIIEVYLEKDNEIRNGSKFTLGATGGKGTVQYVIPKDKQPYAVDSKLKIDFVATPMSLISRKNPSILMLLYSGKIVFFLNKRVSQMILDGRLKEAETLLKTVYGVLDKSEDHYMTEAIDAFFKNSPDFIKSYVKRHIGNKGDDGILQNPPFPMIVPPFKNKVQPEDLDKAAKILGISLNEKVYVPEEDVTTEYEVTVGIMPVYLLEHFPKEMSSVRGMINAKRQSTTGQGRSGTKEGNGAISLGLYDMFSLMTREPDKLLKELWTLKADSKGAKDKLIRQILKAEDLDASNVKVENINIDPNDLLTKKLIENYFIGAILEPQF